MQTATLEGCTGFTTAMEKQTQQHMMHPRLIDMGRPPVKLKPGLDLNKDSHFSEREAEEMLGGLSIKVKVGEAAVSREQHGLKLPVSSKLSPSAPVLENITGCMDIDRSNACRKVMPVEDEEESSTFELKVNRKRPSKRSHTSESSTTKPVNFSQSQTSYANIKKTQALIDKAQAHSNEEEEIIYAEQKFSGFDNIKQVTSFLYDKGSFGQVGRFVDEQTKQTLVLKRMNKLSEITANEILVPIQFPEVQNIAQIFGCQLKNATFSIVMEDAGHSLPSLINDQEFQIMLKMPQKPEHLLLGMLKAIAALASCQVVHKDIKPENVCFNKKTGVIKLVDFGSSSTQKDKVTYKGTTIEYADPQTCQDIIKFLKASQEEKTVMELPRAGEGYDMWATMMVMLFLYLKKHATITLFYDESGNYSPKLLPHELCHIRFFQVAREIAQLTDTRLWNLLYPIIPSGTMSFVMEQVLYKGLTVDPKHRPSALELRDSLQKELAAIDEGRSKQKALRLMDMDNDSEMPMDESDIPDINLKSRSYAQPHAHMKNMPGVSADLPMNEGPALAVAIKNSALPQQPQGGIMMPAKFTRGQGGATPVSFQPQRSKKVMEPEYKDLVESFLKKEPSRFPMQSKPAVNCQIGQRVVTFGQPSPVFQAMATPSPQVQMGEHPFTFHMRQPHQVQGLFGRRIIQEGQDLGPSPEQMEREKVYGGNIPNFL